MTRNKMVKFILGFYGIRNPSRMGSLIAPESIHTLHFDSTIIESFVAVGNVALISIKHSWTQKHRSATHRFWKIVQILVG